MPRTNFRLKDSIRLSASVSAVVFEGTKIYYKPGQFASFSITKNHFQGILNCLLEYKELIKNQSFENSSLGDDSWSGLLEESIFGLRETLQKHEAEEDNLENSSFQIRRSYSLVRAQSSMIIKNQNQKDIKLQAETSTNPENTLYLFLISYRHSGMTSSFWRAFQLLMDLKEAIRIKLLNKNSQDIHLDFGPDFEPSGLEPAEFEVLDFEAIFPVGKFVLGEYAERGFENHSGETNLNAVKTNGGSLESKAYIFVATGTGIAPILAILDQIYSLWLDNHNSIDGASADKNTKTDSKIYVYWATSKKVGNWLNYLIQTTFAELFDSDLFELKVVFREDADMLEFVQREFVSNNWQKCSSLDFYACGNPQLIDSLESLLSQIQTNEQVSVRFYKEKFS